LINGLEVGQLGQIGFADDYKTGIEQLTGLSSQRAIASNKRGVASYQIDHISIALNYRLGQGKVPSRRLHTKARISGNVVLSLPFISMTNTSLPWKVSSSTHLHHNRKAMENAPDFALFPLIIQLLSSSKHRILWSKRYHSAQVAIMVTDVVTIMPNEINAGEVSTGQVGLKVCGSCRHRID
jgi:hypothetical protein